MSQLAIIADDLTGAADTSACFADAGFSVALPLQKHDTSAIGADVTALTTESRDLAPDASTRIVGAAVSGACAASGTSAPRWIYKKIDSALRGNPRDELLAAMAAIGAARTLVAPALPAEGRTTIDGRQHIGGVPLESSLFGSPGATSDLCRLFANNRDLPIEHLGLEPIRQRPEAVAALLDNNAPGIIIADAETDDDLAILARAAAMSNLRVLCGAAGFARQLALTLPISSRAPAPVTARRAGGPVLVVAGSQHLATKRQLDRLSDTGIPVVRLTQRAIDEPVTSLDATIAEVAAHLARGQDTVVTTSGLAPSTSRERSVASRLAEVASAPAIKKHVGGLVLTGGDVAAAVCLGLGATAIWLGGEIYAGQPWGVLDGGSLPGLPVATKAGSFGRDGALQSCIAHLAQITGRA